MKLHMFGGHPASDQNTEARAARGLVIPVFLALACSGGAFQLGADDTESRPEEVDLPPPGPGATATNASSPDGSTPASDAPPDAGEASLGKPGSVDGGGSVVLQPSPDATQQPVNAPPSGATGRDAGTGSQPHGASTGGPQPDHWVGTWGAAPQLIEPANRPSGDLKGHTLRQVFLSSIGGKRLRMSFSNQWGKGPLELNFVHLALAEEGSAIDTFTDTQLSFGGKRSVVVPRGKTVWSDPFDFELPPRTRVTVSIELGTVPKRLTGHPGSRTTSFISSTHGAKSPNTEGARTHDGWLFITSLDVMASAETRAAVILGDSISDGLGSTVNGNDRWPDVLARRLLATGETKHVSMVNMAVGGNALLAGGYGPPAVERFHRDVVGTSGALWVLVLLGHQDICWGGAKPRALIQGYEQLIKQAHDANLKIYGAPLLPFGGHPDCGGKLSIRREINDWIRTSSAFDEVLELGLAVADPANPTRLLPRYNYRQDGLHLSPAGSEKVAQAIDLTLFRQ